VHAAANAIHFVDPEGRIVSQAAMPEDMLERFFNPR
jgi:hypothetical protein